MNTKTSILTALVALASGTGAMAQVYSQNVVGYVNVPITAGFTMIANPVQATDNTIGALIPEAPLFSGLYKWNGSGFDIATFTFSGWDHPEYTLNPGEGAFFNSDSASTFTFVGEVLQGALVNPIPSGFSVRSSKVPQSGDADTLGLTASLGLFDNVYKWNGSDFVIYTLTPGGWDPAVPTIGVGESVFVNAAAPTSWDRTFTVN